MHLTIKSLNKANEVCQEYLKFEDAIIAESGRELVEDIHGIQASIASTIELYNQVDDMRKSLESVGYSDEWFDTIAANGQLEGIVDFNMPKFFDNPVNRGKACMEGFVDGLKKFIMAICNFIMNAIRKIMSAFDFVIKMFASNDTAEMKLKGMLQTAEKVFSSAVIEKWLQENPISISGWYPPEQIIKMYDGVNKLLKIVVPGTDFNGLRAGILDANEYQGRDSTEINKEYFANLATGVASAGMQPNDPSLGFVLEHQVGTSSFVKFFGSDPNYKMQEVQRSITGQAELKTMLEQEISNLKRASQDLCNNVIALKKAMTMRAKTSHDIMVHLNTAYPDPDMMLHNLRDSVITSNSLSIVAGAVNFIFHINNYRMANVKAAEAVVKLVNESMAKDPNFTK